jgi:FkbM family methyltransferase
MLALTAASNSAAFAHADPLERFEHSPGSSSSSRRTGCTLNLTAADLEHRRYGRLWLSRPHWQAWQRAGADRMRRLRDPTHFRGGEVLVDVGSYVGVDLVNFLRRAPATVTVHTFEPVAMYREKLQQRVRRFVASGHERLHIHAFGLGKSNHTACFAASKAASTDELSGTSCNSPSEIVDAAVALRQFPPVDVMQLNCEGCEYEVLERLLESPAALATVRSFEVQFHLDWGAQKDTARYCRIEAGLRAAAFALDYRHPFLWERWSKRSGA